MLNRQQIAARIPHQGDMCLLAEASAWSPAAIRCRAVGHVDASNPLRADGRLGAAAGIEYAAQAMALHGALLAACGERPRQGYLTSVRAVTLHVARLDDLAGDLTIEAERLSGDENYVLYGFRLRHGECCVVEGRASVVLDAALVAGGQ